MPISFPLTLPAEPGFLEFEWDPDSSVAKQINPFDLTRKIYVWEGQIRLATVKVSPMTRAQAMLWQACFHALNGIQGTFYLQDPVGAATRGAYLGRIGYSPAVKGAGQTGVDLLTDGWPHSLSGLLLAGDWIAIAGRLYQLLADTNSDGSGNATLTVWPNVGGLADDAPISVGAAAFGTFRLTAWPKLPWDVEYYMQGVTFGVEEAVPAT